MGSTGSPTFFPQRVVVGVGEMSVSNDASITLSTYALGSCVGVAAYDPVARTGGLLHLMLPDSKISPEKATSQPAMFADTGLVLLFKSLAGLRADRARLQIIMAGGSSMICTSDAFRIGERNIRATVQFLAKHGFVVKHASLAGTTNRTLHLDIGTGAIQLKSPAGDESWSLAE